MDNYPPRTNEPNPPVMPLFNRPPVMFKLTRRRAILTISLMLVFAVIAIISTWYVMDNRITKQRTDNAKSVQVLQNIISDLKNQLPQSKSTLPTMVLSSTTGWQTYSDDINGFSLKYPAGTLVNANVVNITDGSVLFIKAESMGSISEASDGLDAATAQKDLAAIQKGDPTTPMASGLASSFKLLSIKGAYGKQFIVTNTSTCDVQFDAYAVIYEGNYRIILSYKDYDTSGLIYSNPAYFTNTDSDCPNQTVWNSQNSFYSDLINYKTDALSQTWFMDFNTIVSTLTFTK